MRVVRRGPGGTRPPTAAAAPTGRGIGPLPTSTPPADPPDADFPRPDPAFAAHFADPIYHDQGDDLAPFGSDEGFDTLYTWQEHREDLTACTTVRSMLGPDWPRPPAPPRSGPRTTRRPTAWSSGSASRCCS